ncbi:branched-chain amino acid ABC transporter permease [Neobacillus niacini]|jgi:branched-chain amino acid transport system permease protein|uniref:branched-chain amino acid ABC transporter permease n=1 Tax=Neobacillus niacini TaxID=86668 RepID=UPI00203BF197|nr:branched-chain amino acid ABC transporter permease [Neobacillus niacini]MCM3692587.1 branched-chain amino acid ABC transporter permease [Neobacillus niacini]
MDLFIVNTLSGLTYGMLLFLMASGLSIVFGLMRIINLAHGSFFLFGSYVAYAMISRGMNFWLALLLSTICVTVLALLLEKFLISRFHGNEASQVLLTLGLIFVIGDITLWIWGGDFLSIPVPSILDFSFAISESSFPIYRLFVIAIGIICAVLLWYFETKTKVGMIIRAGVDDMEMVGALGFNIKLIFSAVFLFGAALAAIGGVLSGPILGMYPKMEFEILVNSLVIVLIGGLGSWKGAFIGAILIGIIDSFGKIYLPDVSVLLIFVVMVIVLMFKPTGLFGRVES